MCITMLQLSFTAEYLVQMFSFPLAYGLFQLLDGFLIVAAYQTYKRRLKNKQRRRDPEHVEGCPKQRSTSPKETRAFLEVNEEAAGAPGPPGPTDGHMASGEQCAPAGPAAPLSPEASKGGAGQRHESHW